MGFLSNIGSSISSTIKGAVNLGVNTAKDYVGAGTVNLGNIGDVVGSVFNVYQAITTKKNNSYTSNYTVNNTDFPEDSMALEKNEGFLKGNLVELKPINNPYEFWVLNGSSISGDDKTPYNESIFSLKIPKYGYDRWLNERYMFQRGLGNLFGEPGYFYYRIFFKFDTQHGLLGGIMNGGEQNAMYTHNSAYKYLSYMDSAYYKTLQIQQRKIMLTRFVKTLSYISTNCPWFFKSIRGLDKVANPIAKEFSKEKTIEIECNQDAIDMRLNNLMDMYKFAAYDDLFKREILPENMRKFDMSIMVFSSPINKLHFPIAHLNKTVPFNTTDDPSNNMMSFKLFEFIGCEIDPESIGSMVPGDMNNEEPFALGKGIIKIKYDQCYHHISNEFDQILYGSDGIFYDYERSINTNRVGYNIEDRIPAFKSDNAAVVSHFGNLLADYAVDNVSKLVNKGLGNILGSFYKNLTTLGYLPGYDKYGPGSKTWQDKVDRLTSKYIHTYSTAPNKSRTYYSDTTNMLQSNLKDIWAKKVRDYIPTTHVYVNTTKPYDKDKK